MEGGFGMVLLVLAIYFMPAFIAGVRDHHNTAAITLLTLFLGWTLIGWVIALVWSATNLPDSNDSG